MLAFILPAVTRGDLREVVSVLAVAAAYAVFARLEHSRTPPRWWPPPGSPSASAPFVSRGGRPDLAAHVLAKVRIPTLLIVGGRDEAVTDLNRQASKGLRGESRVEVVPDATHLFEEPGALEQVGTLAASWFASHLAGVASVEAPRGLSSAWRRPGGHPPRR